MHIERIKVSVQERKADMRTAARFTLIELLVVCAIIIMLAGLLLPSLKMAKDKSRQITCLSNYKNLYTAVLCYTQDYNDWMPYTWDGPVDHPQYAWPRRLYPYITTTKNYRGVFCCPSNPQQERLTYSSDLYACNYAYFRLGDTRFSSIYSGPYLYTPRKISKCPTPSAAAVMIDGNCNNAATAYFAYADIWSLIGFLSFADTRHSNGINSMFVDGHANRDDILHKDDMYIHLTYYPTCTCGSHNSRNLVWR